MAKILIFDPDPNESWNLVSDMGHEVFAFHDPGEAVDFARENKVDIALLSTPEGLDLIDPLREISTNFKVVLLSASPQVEEVAQGIRKRACSYLFKPILPEEMEACFKRALLKGKSTTKIALNL